MSDAPVLTLPPLPRSNSKAAEDAITQVMAERSYPCNPAGAARAGFEAAVRLADEQRRFSAAAQLTDERKRTGVKLPSLEEQADYFFVLYRQTAEELTALQQELAHLKGTT